MPQASFYFADAREGGIIRQALEPAAKFSIFTWKTQTILLLTFNSSLICCSICFVVLSVLQGPDPFLTVFYLCQLFYNVDDFMLAKTCLTGKLF